MRYSAKIRCVCFAVWMGIFAPWVHGFPATAIEEDFALTVWETEDDLPNNDVHSLASDQRGFLWVGTASGLVRFDGQKFRAPGLSDEAFFQASTVYSVVEVSPEEMVFVHDQDARNRLMVWSPAGMREHPVNRSLLPTQRVLSVFREREGVLWVLLNDRQWIRWQESGVEVFPSQGVISSSQAASLVVVGERVFLSRGAGVEVYQNGVLENLQGVRGGQVVLGAAAEGGVWIADRDHLHRWRDGHLETLTAPIPSDTTWPPHILLETQDGALWMSFWNAGLFRFGEDRLTQVPTLHRTLRCLLEDLEGNLWVGTAGGGLNRIRRSPFGLWGAEVADTIGSVCEDRRGNKWLGNARGIWKLENGRALPAGDSSNWPTYANAVCVDQEDALWIGGARQIFRMRQGIDEYPMPMEPGEIQHAYAVFCARDGSVWVGCEKGPLLCYRKNGTLESYGPEQGYDGSFAQVFGEDAGGGLWVGTRMGDLFCLKDSRFERLATPLGDSGTGILTITPGADGALWLGTRGIGFLRLKNGVFRTVGKSFGLPDGLIAQTLADDEGNFWIGSSNSIFNVSIKDLDACADGRRKSLRPVKFGRADGINGFFATGQRQPCAFRGRDGIMWFVGRKGVVNFDPLHFKASPDMASTYIDEVRVDDGGLEIGGSVFSSNRRLEFRFASPTFIAPDDMRFRYRLKGFEEDWSETSGQRLAVYPRLAPGRYQFEVTASSRRKRWNPEPTTFAFTVAPVWWEWWWLRLLAVAVALVGIAWGIRIWSNRRLHRKMERLRQEHKVEQERARIARDLHDGIGAGLTKLGWLAGDLKADSKDSPELCEQSSSLCVGIRELARDLDAAVWAVSPKHDTLTSLLAYLCEFAAEHFSRTPIRCRVSTPDFLPSGPLPPHVRNHIFMATREALNNALKHSNASEVSLGIFYQKGRLEIEIADDGQGFDVAQAKEGTRQGLKNLEERMREIQGVAEVRSGPEGTRVRLLIPLGD